MKILKWIVALLIIGAIGGVLYFQFYLLPNTKKASPEDTVEFIKDDLRIDVFYCRPSKKKRQVFGKLVPFNEVWRTGANEATTFESSKDLTIGDQPLPAGKYTLWTIPKEKEWEVIFNDRMYNWGVGANGASRKPDHDKAKITVPAQQLEDAVEMFTIVVNDDSTGVNLSLSWDNVKVSVPIKD